MVPLSRRDLLRLGALGLTAGFAGCSSVYTSTPSPATSPVSTPASSAQSPDTAENSSESPPPGIFDTTSTSSTSTAASSTEPPETYGITAPDPRNCEAQSSPTPTATKELAPVAYPTYPDSITRATAPSFAIAYEEAFWHNWVVRTDWLAGTDEVVFDGPSVPDSAIIEHREGFIIGVEGMLRTADAEPPPDVTTGSETPTSVPYLDLPFSAWYYLTPKVALRKQRQRGLEEIEQSEPDLRSAKTIVCDR